MELRILNINELNIDEISNEVSEKRIDRAKKFKFPEDKLRSIAVEWLLNQMIKEIYPDMSRPVNLEYDEHGKPHLYDEKTNGEVYFSLSHSGDYVACMIDDKPCGVDIERQSRKYGYDRIAKRVCTDRELKLINDDASFYDLWTLKESALKAVGLGLSLNMKDVEFVKCSDMGDDNCLNEKSYMTKVGDYSYFGKTLKAPYAYSLSYVVLAE